MGFKQAVQLIAGNFGFEIRRLNTVQFERSDPYAVMKTLITAPQPTIFDVGAHVGTTAQRLRAIFPDARLVCFEPFPQSFEKLTAACRHDSAIQCHALALAGVLGTATLHVNRHSVTNSLLAPDMRGKHYWGRHAPSNEHEITVKTETLDGFCTAFGFPHIDILKIDAQGGEYAILEGAQRLLQSGRIDVIYMEMITAPTYVGQRKFHEYLDMFDRYGFELFDMYNMIRKDGRLIQMDSIIVSSALLAAYETNNAHGAS